MPMDCLWKSVSELARQTDQRVHVHLSSVSVLHLQAGRTFGLMQSGHSGAVIIL